MNTSDFAYLNKVGAVEFIPNPYNPKVSLTPRLTLRKMRRPHKAGILY